ncbi:aldose 1-epimerase [Sphingomonas kaistensis]|uniref:Aldose 1-epimerase n=1 Tax=Sphingomonas kaistensis TaxID=298708 RepID=A0A7X6BEZ3_9SPHN|nr:aldose 1-epimerase [Sphingomonas kaistensis]NJC04253.1 aldose 1-epimerase [Sphingomonas kaistensis]
MLQDDHMLALRAGDLELVLSPALGGAIRDLSWTRDGRRIPLMRASREAADSVLDMASFPLVPFVNRIRGGRFTFRGREVVLKPNMAGDISPLHGQGWLAPWTVKDAGENHAELHFTHEAGEWPWAYEAVQVVTLDERGLSLRLQCRNRDSEPMPCGLGQHPYFPCTAETRIATAVRSTFEIDEHVLPTGEVPATGRYDLSDRAVCGQDLDHGFGGWGGQAVMTDPAWPAPLRLSSPDARFFQLYSPREGGIFVAEPVTHANAALNEPEERWGELGLRVLAPGEEMHLDMRLELAS